MSGAQAERAQSGAAQANYGTLLRAEIMRRRIYPAEAASRGDEGTVMARVTIGPNGTAVSHAVVRGSGISSFDRVVPQIMARLSLPPPPGGHYTATVAIRFALD
jgi:protein TonB